MTKEQELIDELKEHLYLEEKDIDLCLYDEEVQMCINALEKQIAKKPLHSIYYPNGRKHHHIYCGKCGMYRQRVSMSDNYCRNCGTKIDWSESDD
jgi:hypothetical protein